MKAKKIISIAVVFISTIFYLTAQDSSVNKNKAEEKIQLPDVTTVVSGDSLTAGKNSIPDFSEIVPSSSEESILPKLPDAQSESVAEEPEADLSYGSDKAVYAEGVVGGGYPSFFTGNFSIYKSSGDNPFNLKFSHESANGYGQHSAADGFYDSTTELSGNKQISFNNTKVNLSALYNTKTDGLQSLSECFYSQTKQNVSANCNVEWTLPHDFLITLIGGGEFYSRYEGIDSQSQTSYTAQEAKAPVINLKPKFNVSWNKNENSNLSFAFESIYNFESILGNVEFPAANGEEYTGPTTKYLNRGIFSLSGIWKNNFASVLGQAALVVGDALGDPSVIAPFSLDATFYLNQGSTKLGTIRLQGGLESNVEEYSSLETKYKYTTLSYLPSETSDWFASLNSQVSLGSNFQLNASADWKMTAFGNGVWEPVYSTKQNCGLYSFEQVDRNLVTTDIGFSFLYKLLTLDASWKANWLYVPVGQTQYSVGLSASLQKPNGAWGTTLSMVESLGTDVDLVPIINLTSFFRAGDSIKLGLELNDSVKLFTGKDRAYNNSEYYYRSGSVTFLVKFFF